MLTGVSIIGLAVACIVVYKWQQAHLWPFSLGSKDEAFLGATFGMSPEEVSRALGKHGAQLLNYDEYRQNEAVALIDPFLPEFKPYLNSDERDFYSKYMPSIEMFGAVVQAEFEFRKSRLDYVTVHFQNVPKSAEVVASVKAALEKHYRFVRREENNNFPGAYSLDFASGSVAPSLWVNLTDPKKPIISVGVRRASAESERRKEIQLREQSAFGH